MSLDLVLDTLAWIVGSIGAGILVLALSLCVAAARGDALQADALNQVSPSDHEAEL